MNSAASFVMGLSGVLTLAIGLVPLRKRRPIVGAAAFGAGGSLILSALSDAHDGHDVLWWKVALTAVLAALLWAALARARIWHHSSRTPT